MQRSNRKAKVTDEHRKESAALKQIWLNTPNKLSQEAFGDKFKIGSQSVVNQFLNGVIPISMKAAIGFAEGLGCEISDFSPRLAREAQMIGRAVQPYQIAPSDQIEHPGNAINEKDNELTEKAEIEILKMQIELAKMQARAEIAEAKLEILKPQAENYQSMRDLFKRSEARLAEAEKVLNEMQDKLIAIEKKNNQRAA